MEMAKSAMEWSAILSLTPKSRRLQKCIWPVAMTKHTLRWLLAIKKVSGERAEKVSVWEVGPICNYGHNTGSEETELAKNGNVEGGSLFGGRGSKMHENILQKIFQPHRPNKYRPKITCEEERRSLFFSWLSQNIQIAFRPMLKYPESS